MLTKLTDEKTTCVTIKERTLKSFAMMLGATGGIGVAGEPLSDKQGRDWLMNHWGSLNG